MAQEEIQSLSDPVVSSTASILYIKQMEKQELSVY